MKRGDLSVAYFAFGFLIICIAISMPAVTVGEKIIAISVMIFGGCFVMIGFKLLNVGEISVENGDALKTER